MVKKITACVIGFIVCVAISAAVMILSFVRPLKDPLFWIDCADKIDYYSRVKDYSEKYFRDKYSPPSGIPEECFTDSVTVDNVKTLYEKQVRALVEGKVYSIGKSDTEEIEKKIVERATEYSSIINKRMEDPDLELQREGIQYTADLCINDYKKYNQLSLFSYAENVVLGYEKTLTYAALFCIIIAAAGLAVVIFTLKRRSIRFISYSLLGAGLIGFLPTVFLKVIGFYDRFGFSPDYWNDLFFALENGVMKRMIVCSVCFIVISLGLFAYDIIRTARTRSEN